MDKYNSNNIEDCVQILIPYDIRNIVGAFVWFFMNFFLLIILFIFSLYGIYSYVVLPFYVICNLWGIWVFFYKPHELRLVHILYNGFMGATFSFGSFIVIQKFAYTFIKIETPLFFIVTFSLYIFTMYKLISLGIKSFLRRLNNEEKDKIKISPIVYFSGLGYIIGQICIGSLSQNAIAIVLILVFSLLAVVFGIDGVYLYFYFDLKKQQNKLDFFNS